MYRRGYLTLAGSGLVAGCTGRGGQPESTVTATDDGEPGTEAPLATGPETATDAEPADPETTETSTATGDDETTGAIEAARRAIRNAYELYLSHGGEETTQLLSVGPATRGFDDGRIRDTCETALDHLDAAAATAAGRHAETVDPLRTVTTWLADAAHVQGRLSDVAEQLAQAGASARREGTLDSVTSPLETARERTDAVRDAVASIEAPRAAAFDAVGVIDGGDAVETTEQFQRWAARMEELAVRLGEVRGAVDALGEARAYRESGNAVLAEAAAEDATAILARADDRAGQQGADPIAEVVDLLRPVLDALRERAATIGADETSDG